MSETVVQTSATDSDEAYQDRILPQVSRTFALTIPQLPPSLRTAITNAYLLCRIADTIEDEPTLSADAALQLLRRFVLVVAAGDDDGSLSQHVARQLSAAALAGERELVANLGRVVRVTARLPPAQRAAILRCVEEMCFGMHHFQRTASADGLPRLVDLEHYCYYVAGVVGRMLTDLFCDYSPVIAQRSAALHARALSFAQGLQMTNILKDVWEDRARGACWLPQDVFGRHGVTLSGIEPGRADAGFTAGMRELLGIANRHLHYALEYTLLIPPDETGIRRFCLWAIGLAVATLRNIDRRPGFASGADVKVPRRAVASIVGLTNVLVRRDAMLRLCFRLAARRLPLAGPQLLQAPSRLEVTVAAARGADVAGTAAVAARVERRSAS
jgi:farnesyl-diphosphate farnesyltransferase